MNAQERFWQGRFGNEYTERNRVEWSERIPFWRTVLDHTDAKSVIEVGCNAGWNLLCIQRLRPKVIAGGLDVNGSAVAQALNNGLSAIEGPISQLRHHYDHGADLVFTCGVLIHIGPDELLGAMQSIVDTSRKWVLAVEYAAETEEEVEYRGHQERLWRRPFGKLYEKLGLRLAGKSNPNGFDRCTAWLMEKR